MINLHYIAGELYDQYCLKVGGIAFNGDPLPTWEEFSNDPTKEKQYLAWIAVAERALQILRND